MIPLSSVTSGRRACDWDVEPGSSFTHLRNISFEMTAADVINPCSTVFTSLSSAVYDDCVYCLCAQLFSQPRFVFMAFPPVSPIFFSPPPPPPSSFLPPDSSSPSQAKVRELEEKCRTQSEQFNFLSKELEKFRLHAGKFDILSTEPLTVCESPGSPNKSLSQLLNGLAAPVGKGRIIQPSYQPFVSVFPNCVVII